MYNVWYNVSTQKNWPCASNKTQDPLSKQLTRERVTIATSACDNTPFSYESLGTKNTPQCPKHLCVLYAIRSCMLKEGTMLNYTPLQLTLQHFSANALFVTAFQAVHRKAVGA